MTFQTRALTGSTEARLKDLLDYYGKTLGVHQVIFDLCRSDQHKRLLNECLQHELRVIRSRSQDLKDHEINVYQKAFVILMANDKAQDAGIELYIQEILGLKLLRAAEKDGVLRQAVETRHLVTKKFNIRGSPESTESNKCSHSQRKEGGAYQLESLNFKLPYKLQDNDPRLRRLWNLYESAKEDFLSTPESEWPSHTSSAKFLRDTAENCINYLESKQHLNQDYPDVASALGADSAKQMLKELSITVKVAKDAAEKGSGGKKRRFDHNMEGVPRGPRRMRAETARKPSTYHTPLPTPQKPRSVDDDQRQHAERRDISQDRAEHRATLVHSRELRMAQMDRERSASPKRDHKHTFDERDYRSQRSRVPGYESDHQASDREWRRSEAEDYHSSYYRSGDRIGRSRAEDYTTSYHRSNDPQEMPRPEQYKISYREPAMRERSRVEGYRSSYKKPEKRESLRVADTWRPSISHTYPK